MTDSHFLHQYLDATLIHLQSDISSPKRLLQTMAELLSSALDGCKEKTIYQCLLEREKLGNTGIGNGVALPHSRSPFTDKPIIAIITLKEAIDYDSLDKQPVNIAFGLLVPKNTDQQHLTLLAEIAKLMSNNEYKKQLLSAHVPAQALKLIGEWQKI